MSSAVGEAGTARGQPGHLPSAFRAFAAASGVSAFGDYLNVVALSLFAFERTGSATATGALMALRLATGLLAAPLAGRLATRHSRRAVLVSADLVQAAALTALALLASSQLAVPAAFAASATIGVGATAASVALRAGIPAMVGAAARTDANGLLIAVRSAATVLGFASAGVILALGGYATAFLVDAATFVVSAAVVAVLPLPLRERSEQENRRPSSHAPSASASTSSVGGMIAVRTLDAAGSGSHNVALPVFFAGTAAHAASWRYASFLAAWATGSLVMSTVLRRSGRSWLRQPGLTPFVAGTCAMSAFFILAFAGWALVPLLGIAAAAGAADGFTAIAYTSRLQAEPEAQRGRVFARSAAGENGGLGAGMLAAGLLLPSLGSFGTVLLMHGLAMAAAATLLLRVRSAAPVTPTTSI